MLLDPTFNSEELKRVIDLSLKVDSQISKSIALEALALKAKSADMWDDFQAVVERYPVFKAHRRA